MVSKGIALGGDHFFDGVAINGWVLFLEAAVEENDEVADVTTRRYRADRKFLVLQILGRDIE